MGDLSNINGFPIDRIAAGRSMALRYEKKGWSPLPSRHDDKRPLISFAQYWEGGLPPVSELWDRHPSGNIQLITGSTKGANRKGEGGLVALDLDGKEGIETFKAWLDERKIKALRTWVISNDERQGRHLWFRLPRITGLSAPKRLLWGVWLPEANEGKGGWKKRAAVEFIGDRSLIMAPPSVHPKTGRKYQFHRGSSPLEMPSPAVIPAWLLAMPTMQRGKGLIEPEPRTVVHEMPESRRVRGDLRLPVRASEVLAAIGDKTGLAITWGLRVANWHPNEAGWIKVHAIDRPDDNPSASFNPITGRYWEETFNNRRSICLFRLGVELGIYASWREACIDLGRAYLPHIFSRSLENVR